MVTLAVARDVIIGGPVIRDDTSKRPHPKMRIVAEGKKAFVVPYAPRDINHSGFAPVFTSVDRGGREPLLIRAGGTLQVMTFELTLGYLNWNKPIESELKALVRIAESGARMRVKLNGLTAARRWRLTDFNFNITMLQQGTNAPTRATAQFTFTESSDPVTEVGPVSGGKKGGKGDDDKWPKFYVLKKGDTLHTVSNKFYGDPSFWSLIADANKIRHPNKVKVGTKLRVPKPLRGFGSSSQSL